MRIEHIELRQIGLALKEPFQTSFGVTRARRILLVIVEGEGLTGYGECVAGEGPWYSSETVETARHILADFLVPAVLGKTVAEPSELTACFAPVRGHNMAKAALEMAGWDLLAKAKGVSLSHFLGGSRERIESGVSIGIQPRVEDLLTRIEGYLAQGYRRVKVKIQPGWDVDVVAEIRRHLPTVPLMLDANSAYTLADLPTFRELDNYDLMMIEQPLGYEDIIDHATLQRQLRTPICLDESIHSPEDGRKAIESGACRVINIKAGRLGGLYPARQLHDVCQERGIPVWCGGMLETGIGRAHNVALSTLPNFRLPGDVSASDRYYAQEIITSPFRLSPDGTIPVPQGPGVGVEVDRAMLERLTLHKETFAGANHH
ncbi:MAG: o-succinylbenzoate synthase [Chloroflexota bacterium]